jgi:hypothetical protein
MSQDKPVLGPASGSPDLEPTCEKCGAPITTGLMAAFCPKGKDCEFWVPEFEEFLKDWQDPLGERGEK